MGQVSATMNCGARNQDAYSAANVRGLLDGEICEYKSGGARQCLTGTNAYWNWHAVYNRRSVDETAI